MNFIDTLKRWLGFKPEPKQVDAAKVVTLPNGRKAAVDEFGNFVGFSR